MSIAAFAIAEAAVAEPAGKSTRRPPPGTATISVVQIGDYAESRPATVSLTLG